MTTENTTTGIKAAGIELLIGGMTCASCANRIEKKLNKLDGVEASVNYATEKASITGSETLDPQALIAEVDQDTYCIDVLTQISAVTSALENVALGLLEDHLKHCVVNAAKTGGPEAEEKIKEASAAITRLVKS